VTTEGRARLVPLPGSRLKTVGLWGLGAGGVGGLGLDALSYAITGQGNSIRIALSAGLCLASGAVIVVGLLADRRLRETHERGDGAR